MKEGEAENKHEHSALTRRDDDKGGGQKKKKVFHTGGVVGNIGGVLKDRTQARITLFKKRTS